MLKRKFGDRSEWKRVLKRKYSQTYLEDNEFKGYITLLNLIEVTEPLSVNYEEKRVRIVDDGYMWLQQFPLNEHHSVTTMFDANGEIVQWYIDICLCNGVENGIPWMEDLFLDIILLPSGEIIEKDADELEDALSKGIINKTLYELAWNEMNRLFSKRMLLLDKTILLIEAEGGDSCGKSVRLETPQERLATRRLKPRPRKASTCSGNHLWPKTTKFEKTANK